MDVLLPVVMFAVVLAATVTVIARLRSDAVLGAPRSSPATIAMPGGRRLELAAAGLANVAVADLIDDARAAVASFDLVDGCSFERFPFDKKLPRLAHGRLELPADEPGLGSISTWQPAQGVEVLVSVRGLIAGRLVVFGPIAGRLPSSAGGAQERILAVADRLGSALSNSAFGRGDLYDPLKREY